MAEVYLMRLSSAIKQQAIAWATLDSDLYRHMALLDHNELMNIQIRNPQDFAYGFLRTGFCSYNYSLYTF